MDFALDESFRAPASQDKDALNLVFKHLDAKSLKSARLVCETWNLEASAHLNERSEFDSRFLRQDDFQDALDCFKNGLSIPPQRFIFSFRHSDHFQACETFINVFGFRLTSLKLVPWKGNLQLDRKTLARILFQSPYLSTLEVALFHKPPGEPNNPYLFPRTIPRAKILLPNMRSLTLHGSADCNAEYLADLLLAMPSLGSLKVYDARTDFLDELLCALEFMARQWTAFESLHIIRPFDLQDYHVGRLCLLGPIMRLKAFGLLSVQRTARILLRSAFEALFRALAPTLTDLQTPRFRDSVFAFEVPRMEGLRKLFMEDSRALGPLTFLKEKLPSLESLELVCVGWNEMEEFKTLVPTCLNMHLTLTDLTLPANFDDAGRILTILGGFPNLKKLKIWASDRVLRDIYKRLPGLAELELHSNSDVSDFGITGLSQDQVKELHELNFGFAAVSAVLDTAAFCISELKELKRLSLNFRNPNKNLVSDVSITCGVGLLQTLNFLSIRNFNITDSALAALSILPLMHLELGDLASTRITPSGLTFIKSELPYLRIFTD